MRPSGETGGVRGGWMAVGAPGQPGRASAGLKPEREAGGGRRALSCGRRDKRAGRACTVLTRLLQELPLVWFYHCFGRFTGMSPPVESAFRVHAMV